MKIKRIITGLILLFSFAQAQQSFNAERYAMVLRQAIASLANRKATLEKKRATQQERQQMLHSRNIIVNPIRESQYNAIESANAIVNQSIDRTIQRIKTRIQNLQNQQRVGFSNSQDELKAIRKLELKERIADIEENIEQAKTSSDIFASERASLFSSNPLVRNLLNTQTQLQTKLQRARSELAELL